MSFASKLNPKAASFVPMSQRVTDPNHNPFIVILIGPPGAGKTTQGRLISKHFGFEFFGVSDVLRESLRRHDRDVKSASVLDEKLGQLKADPDSRGIVIEWVTKPDHLVIIDETCRRHDLKVGCTLVFEADDIEELVARICHQHNTERPDRPFSDSILQRIHDHMFVEDTFRSQYEKDDTACFIQALKPYVEVALQAISFIDSVTSHSSACETSLNEGELVLAPSLMPRTLTPPQYPCLQFVRSKKETLCVLTQLNNFLGMKSGNLRRFPGTVATPLDEVNMKTACSNNCSKYYIAKKATGARFIGLYIRPKPDNRDGLTGWFFIDRHLLVFRVQTYPEPDSKLGDMLIDGVLTTARNKFFFLAFDTLYFNGCSVMGETLDSRLEHLYSIFPPENVMEQQVKIIGGTQVSMLYQNFFPVFDLPRLIREFDIPSANLYDTSGVVFASRGTSYKVGIDKNTFKWQPSCKISVDFRLVSPHAGLQGLPDGESIRQYELVCARVMGRDSRELTFDSLDPDCQIPPFSENLDSLVGKVVECVALAPQDPLRKWQIVNVKADKSPPMKEETVKSILLTCMTGDTLAAVYHKHSQTQPDLVQAPPMPHGSPISLTSPSDHRSGSPPHGLSNNNGLPIHPLLQHSHLFGTTPTHTYATPAAQLYPPHQHQLHLAMLQPHQIMFTPATIDPANNVLSNPPVPSGRLDDDRGNRKDPNRRNRTTMEEDKENTPNASIIPFPTKPVKKPLAPTPVAPSSPMRVGGYNGAIPCTPPPNIRYTNSRAHSGSRTSPYRQSPSYRDSPTRVSPMRSSPHRSPIRQSGGSGRSWGMRSPETPIGHYSRHSPPLDFYPNSPPRSLRNDSGFSEYALPGFVQSVKEWIIRKFTPPPSMAKPRPYTVFDLNLLGLSALQRWDKYRSSYCLAICNNKQIETEGRQYMTSNPESEMKADFFVDDCMNEAFQLPQTCKTSLFDVIVSFNDIQRSFVDEETCQRFMHMLARHLKKGGIFLMTTVDREVILDKLKNEATRDNTFGNSEYSVKIDSDVEVIEKQPFGHKYHLNIFDKGPEDDDGGKEEYLVNIEALTACATKAGLGYVDYGHLNFHEVATYLKKQHLATWQRLMMENPDQCELARLYCTGVYKKEANV